MGDERVLVMMKTRKTCDHIVVLQRTTNAVKRKWDIDIDWVVVGPGHRG
jgi:hypothetical protein